MIIDLHTHTRFGSNCSYMYPDQLAQEAKKVGLDAVCITEHDLTWEEEAIKALCQRHQLLVLGGMEVGTDWGSVLVFGFRGPVLGAWRAEELRELVDKAGGVMIAAHPFRGDVYRNGSVSIEEVCHRSIFRVVDAVEIFNGLSTPDEVAFGCEVLRRLGLNGVGGSDSHAPHALGRCVTVFERPITQEEDFLAELKAGRFKAFHRTLKLTY